jgi:RimJ/RimL family protein N-acetyltransferase
MLNTILIQLDKIDLDKPESYNKLEGFGDFLLDLKSHNIEIFSLNDLKKEYAISKSNECLVISDLSKVIEECVLKNIPSIAYDNKELLKQDLFKANMLIEGFQEVNYTFLLEVYQRFHHQPVVIAKTKRVIIREMILEDLEQLYELYAEPSMTRFLEPLYEKEEEIEFTKAYIKNMYGFYGYGLWSLIDVDTQKLIGRAGLSNREVDGEIQIELGYMIGVPYQRQQIAFEVCEAILKFVVKRLQCYFVNCFIHPENIASIALVKKLGFAYRQAIDIGNEKLYWYRWTYEE